MAFLVMAVIFVIAICLFCFDGEKGKNVASEFGIKDSGDALGAGCLSTFIFVFFGILVLIALAGMLH